MKDKSNIFNVLLYEIGLKPNEAKEYEKQIYQVLNRDRLLKVSVTDKDKRILNVITFDKLNCNIQLDGEFIKLSFKIGIDY